MTRKPSLWFVQLRIYIFIQWIRITFSSPQWLTIKNTKDSGKYSTWFIKLSHITFISLTVTLMRDPKKNKKLTTVDHLDLLLPTIQLPSFNRQQPSPDPDRFRLVSRMEFRNLINSSTASNKDNWTGNINTNSIGAPKALFFGCIFFCSSSPFP